RDAVRLAHLAVGVLQEKRLVALRDADARIARRETRGMTAACDALPSGFDADQLHRVVHETLEDTHRVRAPADARVHPSRQFLLALEDLRARLDADDRLEVRHE